ncbi:MAG: hypothetical protein M1816_003645 [Peltula sp. TS41687]|nr:MAG: hypothetical protein M1816_003645 [Peltula sp. TS41687]
MISYLAHQASSIIPCGQIPVQTSTPQSRGVTLPSVEMFIRQLVRRSKVGVGILMSTLVYLDRLRQSLPATVCRALNCTIHRIFLVSLILAAKNLNDSSPKNLGWARYSHVPGYDGWGFSLPEVNLMERQLLSILEWNVRITQKDLLSQLELFFARASVGVLELYFNPPLTDVYGVVCHAFADGRVHDAAEGARLSSVAQFVPPYTHDSFEQTNDLSGRDLKSRALEKDQQELVWLSVARCFGCLASLSG